MNTRSTTVRWVNEHKEQAEEKLDFVFKHNIDGIKNLILKVLVAPMVLVIQEWQQNQMLILGQHIHIGLFHIMTYQLFTMAKLQIIG